MSKTYSFAAACNALPRWWSMRTNNVEEAVVCELLLGIMMCLVSQQYGMQAVSSSCARAAWGIFYVLCAWLQQQSHIELPVATCRALILCPDAISMMSMINEQSAYACKGSQA